MSCSDCMFWVREEDERQLGECRRFPPTVLAGETLRDNPESSGFDPLDAESIMIRSIWPITTESSWCGEFKLDKRAN